MHILYFTRNFNVHDQRYLSALAETEHQISLMSFENSLQPISRLAIPPGISTLNWRGGIHPSNWHAGYRLREEIAGILNRLKPDLVHAGPIQSSAFVCALAGFHPLVSMSWGYDLLVDGKLDQKMRSITRYTLMNSDAMVGDCQTIRQEAIASGMHTEGIVTFPWGINLQHFRPNPELIKDTDTFTLLSTRAWESIYGIDTIAQAFVESARRIPQLRLVMLGDGSLDRYIRQIFLEGSVLEQVNFAGFVEQAELPAYYQSADLYIAATHSDGSSISLLEAMACGTPVLVSNIPGNKEWIESGKEGWLFPVGDSAALSASINHAWEQRTCLTAMGQAARTAAERSADWEINFPKLFEAYNLALSVSGKSKKFTNR